MKPKGVVSALWRCPALANGGAYLRHAPSQLVIPYAAAEHQQLIERISGAVIRSQGKGTAAAYFERLLNGMVYALFFPEELHAQKLHFFDLFAAAHPPETTAKSDWAAFHEQIADVNHPIYAALFQLNGLEVVRIIEGRE